MNYTSILEKDKNGELYFIIPDDLIKELGWKEGDDLDFTIDGDTIIIVRKEEKND